MTEEFKRQCYRIFSEALELPLPERKAFLNQACGISTPLRREVEALLAKEDQPTAGGVLNTPAPVKFAGLLAQTPEATVMAGQPLVLNERYEIPDPRQPLGEGGFGKVFLAFDRHLHDRRVVVKTLKPVHDPKINEYITRKFHGDIDALSRFRHPNLVGILDQGTLPGSNDPFFVMEWIEGESLRDAMKRGRLDFARTARIVEQAGRALSYAHKLGVHHRDLKPDNIMLRREDDSVVVIDFGIATVQEWPHERQRGGQTRKTMLVGTAEYMAPEQIRGEPCAASDIWALDVISFELLTGQLPFAVPRDAQTGQVQWPRFSEMLEAGLQVTPSALCPHLPAAAESVILKSLAFDPSARHPEARQFGEGLAAALIALSPTAQPITPAQPPTEVITGPTAEITEPLDGNAFSPGQAPAVSPVQALQNLQSLRSIASPTNRIWPRLVSKAEVRGMGAKPQHRYRQGDRLRLVIDSEWEGHLLLLDEGPEGIIYCLCPSLFAPDTRLRRQRSELPQTDACADAFEITGDTVGREHLLAIISNEPLGLDWLPHDPQEPARVLAHDDINALLTRLRGLDGGRWRVFSTYFDVIA